jgi:hypothetical protein
MEHNAQHKGQLDADVYVSQLRAALDAVAKLKPKSRSIPSLLMSTIDIHAIDTCKASALHCVDKMPLQQCSAIKMRYKNTQLSCLYAPVETTTPVSELHLQHWPHTRHPMP